MWKIKRIRLDKCHQWKIKMELNLSLCSYVSVDERFNQYYCQYLQVQPSFSLEFILTAYTRTYLKMHQMMKNRVKKEDS